MRETLARKINHLGIAVHSLDSAEPFYRDILGMRSSGREEVAEQKVRVAFFDLGESRIELLEPTAANSPIARFLERRGPGLHHIAYECTHLRAELDRLAAQGVRLIDREPRRGAHGMSIAFIHPKASGGVLTELCEPAAEAQ
jgi:methylmalonyl-CoA/ethylmalonyl-CoA epimerase